MICPTPGSRPVGLVGKGVLSSYDDIKKWVDEKWNGGDGAPPQA